MAAPPGNNKKNIMPSLQMDRFVPLHFPQRYTTLYMIIYNCVNIAALLYLLRRLSADTA